MIAYTYTQAAHEMISVMVEARRNADDQRCLLYVATDIAEGAGYAPWTVTLLDLTLDLTNAFESGNGIEVAECCATLRDYLVSLSSQDRPTSPAEQRAYLASTAATLLEVMEGEWTKGTPATLLDICADAAQDIEGVRGLQTLTDLTADLVAASGKRNGVKGLVEFHSCFNVLRGYAQTLTGPKKRPATRRTRRAALPVAA